MNDTMGWYLLGMAQGVAEQEASRQLAEARTWPGFREAEREIARVWRANASLSLRQAYEQVVEGWRLTPAGFVRG